MEELQASKNGHHDTVQLLLTAWASPNIHDNQGCTALECASINGHYNVTQLLLDNHADPFIKAIKVYITTLMITDLVKHLLKQGIKVSI